MNITIPSIDPDEFHDELARRPGAVVTSPLVGALGPISFLFPDGSGHTYRLVDRTVVIERGVAPDAATVVELDESAFSAFVAEYLTVPGLHIQGLVRHPVGGYMEFDEWEPVLRFVWSGRPVFDPTTIEHPDPSTAFVWGRDRLEDVGAFLSINGFAVVRGVFTPEEVALLDTEIDRLAAAASPTDGDSWWVTGPDGADHVCQLHYTSLTSSAIAAIESDARVRALVDCVDASYVAHPTNGNGHFAVLKNPGSTGGLTDLAWHVDCGLGGHPVLCPSIHIGVQLRSMTPETGEMQFLAGSHLASARRPSGDESVPLPIVAVTAQPGDVTIHVPDAMHAAPPPSGSAEGRRTIYFAFGPPSMAEVFGHKEGYDQMLFKGDGHVGFEQAD